jgi:hypothetical protein
MTNNDDNEPTNSFMRDFIFGMNPTSIEEIRATAERSQTNRDEIISATALWLGGGRYGKQPKHFPQHNAIALIFEFLKNEKPNSVLECSASLFPISAPSLIGGLFSNLRWTPLHAAHTQKISSRLSIAETKLRVFPDFDAAEGQTADVIIYCPEIGASTASNKQKSRYGLDFLLTLISRARQGARIVWLTDRESLYDLGFLRYTYSNPMKFQFELVNASVDAVIEFSGGTLPENGRQSVALVITKSDSMTHKKRFLASPNNFYDTVVNSESDSSFESVVNAFFAGESGKTSPVWRWVDDSELPLNSAIEKRNRLRTLAPKGAHQPVSGRKLFRKVQRATYRLETEADDVIFIPLTSTGDVAASTRDTGVGASSCWRVTVDTSLCDREFLIKLLNSEYGRKTRASLTGSGNLEKSWDLNWLQIPLPSMDAQQRLRRISSDIDLIRAALDSTAELTDRNWAALEAIERDLASAKRVFDLEGKVSNWSHELPFPIATVLRRCITVHANEPKDQFEALLHFYEAFSAFAATLGLTLLQRVCGTSDLAGVLYPKGGAVITRPDFNFWIGAIGGIANRIQAATSDKELAANKEECLYYLGLLKGLRQCHSALQRALRIRNSWKGHGGAVKSADAKELNKQLLDGLGELYVNAVDVFRSARLVRLGTAEVQEETVSFRVELCEGSDPLFKAISVDANRRDFAKSGQLAFWMQDIGVLVPCFPTVRLSTAAIPSEKCAYIFNRYENGQFRWISYQEAQQQEIFDDDASLRALIAPQPS